MHQLKPIELAQWLADSSRPPPLLLDVRETWEWELAHIEGSQHLPMGRIAAEVASLERNRPLVCICHHGVRSLQVARFLEHQDFEPVYNLSGGVAAWAATVDPAMPTY